MSKRDYYEVLGVEREVASADLKKIYRKLALQYHPDQNPDDPGAADKFKEATEAYQVLSDPEKRAHYDRFGHAPPDVGFGGGGMDMGSMTDFFESIFGSVFSGGGMPRGGRSRQGRPGRDLRYDLKLTLEEAVFGADVKISYPRPVVCEDCRGKGYPIGYSPQTCRHCEGAGQVRLRQGLFAVSTTCPACHGAGHRITEECDPCDGRGMVIDDVELEVTIPAGVDDGVVKLVQQQGEAGREGAPDGDLQVVIHIEKHETFVRRGNNLHNVVRITYPQAVLGDEIEVPTIEGPAQLKIKPGTENGQTYRIRSKGVPFLGANRRGDQQVHVEVHVPRPDDLSEEQIALVEKLGSSLGNRVEHHRASFFGKIKELFEQ